MMQNNFNRIAFIYDWLARLVFGSAIREAQNYFLSGVNENDTVIIIGGGTGWIARDLLNIRPACRIIYVEASERMLERARTNLEDFRGQVTFVLGTERTIPGDTAGDGVITNFFLDLFTNEKLPDVVNSISLKLKPDFYWIVTDFTEGRTAMHKIILWLMYRFFYVVCQIEARQLPSWQRVLQSAGLALIGVRDFYGGFIRSALYRANG